MSLSKNSGCICTKTWYKAAGLCCEATMRPDPRREAAALRAAGGAAALDALASLQRGPAQV